MYRHEEWPSFLGIGSPGQIVANMRRGNEVLVGGFREVKFSAAEPQDKFLS